MDIWTIIEEDHRKLDALLQEIKESHGEHVVREFKHELIAHTEAEEKSVYPTFATIGGFAEPVARAAAHDRALRGLVEELGHGPPRDDASRLRQIEAGLAHHIEEEESNMLHLARSELSFHAAEHMKHAFESAKHHAMEGLTAAYPAPEESRTAETVANASAARRDARRRVAHQEVEGRGAAAKLLTQAMRREHDNVFIYEAAIDRLAEASHRSLLGELAEDHVKHADELGKALSALDVKPGKDVKWLAPWAKVEVGGLFNDKAILKAMRSNERHSRRAYERMAEHAPAVARDVLQRLVDDDRRHYDEIDKALHAG